MSFYTFSDETNAYEDGLCILSDQMSYKLYVQTNQLPVIGGDLNSSKLKLLVRLLIVEYIVHLVCAFHSTATCAINFSKLKQRNDSVLLHVIVDCEILENGFQGKRHFIKGLYVNCADRVF